MAFSTEFQAKFKDRNNVVHQLDIEKDGYGGSINTIRNLADSPISIRRRATKTDGDIIIAGSELSFKFISPATDISTYDTLFESNYKDYRVSFYVGSNVRWRGWVKPENFKREFVDNGAHYKIDLSATDAIADLKDVDYPDNSDRVNLIDHIDRCLALTDISLNYKIQLNTYEPSIMSSTDSVMDNITASSLRFVKTDEGRIYQTDANEVLTELLKPFNTTLMQSDGNYWIINYQEPSSYYFPSDFGTGVIGARVQNDLRKDISNWKYRNRGSVEKQGIRFRV